MNKAVVTSQVLPSMAFDLVDAAVGCEDCLRDLYDKFIGYVRVCGIVCTK